jgi:hypothetical protein
MKSTNQVPASVGVKGLSLWVAAWQVRLHMRNPVAVFKMITLTPLHFSKYLECSVIMLRKKWCAPGSMR